MGIIGDTTIATRISIMRQWTKRRTDAHKPWTADELWTRIRNNWPTMDESVAERVFQEVYK